MNLWLEAHIRNIDFRFVVLALPPDLVDDPVGLLSYEALGGIV